MDRMKDQRELYEAELGRKEVVIKELKEKFKGFEKEEGGGEVRMVSEVGTLGWEKAPMLCNF